MSTIDVEQYALYDGDVKLANLGDDMRSAFNFARATAKSAGKQLQLVKERRIIQHVQTVYPT